MPQEIEVVTTWDGFRRKWDSRQNFILRGELFPFQITPPGAREVIEALRKNEITRILHGRDSCDRLDMELHHFPEFRELSLDDAMSRRAALAHFDLRDFSGPDKPFNEILDVMEKWFAALAEHGFEWNNAQRAIFLSGPNCHTPYHFDSSYVLAWQLVGAKRWCWLKEPERWCGHDVLLEQADRYEIMNKPAGIGPDDIVSVDMYPGDVLWNVMLTPHWVDAFDETTYSINLTHFNMRYDGRYSDIDVELKEIHKERAALAAA